MISGRPLESPSAYIWALVSGFPGEKRRRRQLLMLQAFIDESGKGDTQKFVFAGYISSAEKWADFSIEWQGLLDIDTYHYPRLKRFKMQEMRQTPEGLERSEWFYRVIEKYAVAGLSIVIDIPGLIKAVRATQWPQYVTDTYKLENPYFFGFKAIINKLAQYQEQMGISEKVDFIFDVAKEKNKIHEAWDLYEQSIPENTRKLTGAIPNFQDDQEVLPLQAADLYAYWVRQWELDGIKDGVEKLKFPWQGRRDIIRLHGTFNENDFLEEFAKGSKGCR